LTGGPEDIASADRRLVDVVAFGQTSADKALRAAARLKPDVVVIATAKGFALDDAWTASAGEALAGVKTVHTLSIGSTGTSKALAALSKRFGGTATDVTEAGLRELTAR
jgi:hypothetical protein